MLNIGMVVYPGFQPLGLSVGTVFEYANSLNAPIYDFCLVSETAVQCDHRRASASQRRLFSSSSSTR